MAEFLKTYFTKLNWKVWHDTASGEVNNSTSGNMYAYLEVDPTFPTVAFSAHMDTVQKPGEQVQVIFDGSVFKSDGKTILGADNKSGVTALLATATKLSPSTLKNNILFFFPTREEAGQMGSSLFKNNFNANITAIFNLDAGGTPGTFIYRSLGYENFYIKLVGLSAHAAKDYDHGKDAIRAAAKLVALLPVGKNTTEGSTFNVGEIKGGGASNIVCDLVELSGEFRGFTVATMQGTKKKLLDVCQRIEKETGVTITVEFDTKSIIPPFAGDTESAIAESCRKVGKKLGFEAIFKESYSSSDANYYSGLGYPSISVCRGGTDGHTTRETLQFSDLKKAVDIVTELALG